MEYRGDGPQLEALGKGKDLL